MLSAANLTPQKRMLSPCCSYDTDDDADPRRTKPRSSLEGLPLIADCAVRADSVFNSGDPSPFVVGSVKSAEQRLFYALAPGYLQRHDVELSALQQRPTCLRLVNAIAQFPAFWKMVWQGWPPTKQCRWKEALILINVLSEHHPAEHGSSASMDAATTLFFLSRGRKPTDCGSEFDKENEIFEFEP